MPLTNMNSDDRQRDQAQPDADRPAEPVARCGPPAARTRCSRAAARDRRRGSAARAASDRPPPSGADPVALERLLGRPAGEREHRRRDEQHRSDRVDRVRERGRSSGLRSSWRIVAASGRTGSNRKVSPSSGLAAKARLPATIASITASPSARAVASTVAAAIAGRAVRSDTRQIVRQRLTPSAASPPATTRARRRARWR